MKRNTTITTRCGAATLSLYDATEPTMCAYALALDVPVDCEVFDFGWQSAPEVEAARDGLSELETLRAEAEETKRKLDGINARIIDLMIAEAAEEPEASATAGTGEL